ncbi:casein kinase II subunit beta [Theileria orientalis]|uniref:Casein kinase II subunit beta n=1 Tax=Theileria orientalis TaxID=68886 RepID=A0A976QTC6_THEOR|nr:casein kinase II subunit beta [Theileria orientalis]
MEEEFTEWDQFSSESCETLKWIPWFASLEGHEFLLEIEESFVRDQFNLSGLKNLRNYNGAMSMILGPAPTEEVFMDGKFLELYMNATDLYGMLHSRYITTPVGLRRMRDKYQQGVFGQCPRVECQRQNVLPVGFSDNLHNHRIKTYCPRCQEAYVIRSGEVHADIDGAFFGRSFPHLFLLTFPNLIPDQPPVPFVPKIFGFKVHNINSLIKIKLENGEFGTTKKAESASQDEMKVDE